MKRSELRRNKRAQKGWTAAVTTVMERSGGRCEVSAEVCTQIGTQTHHRIRRSQGGTSDPAFLLRTCRECHDFIHANPERAYAQGWLVRMGVVDGR